MNAIELRDVRKTFGANLAVDGVNLAVPRGAVYGVIGPSGAGKTTCIRMIMSILFPDTGSLSVLGRASALEAKDRIGYLPEERGVYRKMRVGAFLTYLAQLKGVSRQTADARVPDLLERVGLRGAERTPCDELSKGMLQRVQFVGAILHEPELLILDEPFSGLDPVSVRLLREQVQRAHARGATILLSTHIMAYAEEMCDHVFMIHEGRKVLDQPMAGLRRQFDPRRILFEPLRAEADISGIARMPDVAHVEATAGGGCTITLVEGAEPSLAVARIAGLIPPARIEIARLRLEDVFIRIVAGGGGLDEAAAALRSRLQAGAAEETRA
ncbi:MAG TPA: ATP-binding cassette domain-containing protein [Vicinamibacterales bacterium]|jgi:ABC-2 type transport system ATP-binding protein|nr:ATP-binding cassette domain-containing protein [Vicinamibacterales bacterium]